jgi:hypothetical protein
MISETRNQFSLTRAASITGGAAKNQIPISFNSNHRTSPQDSTNYQFMSSFRECPNCNCDEPDVCVMRCTECSHIFCGTCSDTGILLPKCPSCGGGYNPIGFIRGGTIEPDEEEDEDDG